MCASYVPYFLHAREQRQCQKCLTCRREVPGQPDEHAAQGQLCRTREALSPNPPSCDPIMGQSSQQTEDLHAMNIPIPSCSRCMTVKESIKQTLGFRHNRSLKRRGWGTPIRAIVSSCRQTSLDPLHSFSSFFIFIFLLMEWFGSGAQVDTTALSLSPL